MKIAVYVRSPGGIHEAVASAVIYGASAVGDMAWAFGPSDAMRQEDAGVVIVYGIGGDAKQVWDANSHAHRILLDKPYARGMGSKYASVRVAVDAFQPLFYFQQFKRPPDRWQVLGIRAQPYKQQSGVILLDGASNKYCLWNDLGNWTEWGRQMVAKIRQHSDLPIVYRPRPSHNVPTLIEGTEFSEGPLLEDFMRSRVVVSHGGNIGFDATVLGVPHFAIGDSIARPLSQTDWTKIGTPRIPLEEKRSQWFYDLAYCQWNLDEFASGVAWKYCRETMDLVDHLKLKLKYSEAL